MVRGSGRGGSRCCLGRGGSRYRLALLSCAALLVASAGTDDGLIGKLQDVIGDANARAAAPCADGHRMWQAVHAGDSAAALRERCIRPLQAATDAASATRTLRPAGGAWPGEKWLTNQRGVV
eukprot:scaffold27535_cov103-Phaeocystis_antarctica.AAC.6